MFEAASLKDVFAKLAPRFEKDNAGVKVIANAAGSQELRTQIEHGAAADVMASADRKHMDALLSQGLVVAPSVFTCNEPVVVVRTALATSDQDARGSAARRTHRDRRARRPDRRLHVADPRRRPPPSTAPTFPGASRRRWRRAS